MSGPFCCDVRPDAREEVDGRGVRARMLPTDGNNEGEEENRCCEEVGCGDERKDSAREEGYERKDSGGGTREEGLGTRAGGTRHDDTSRQKTGDLAVRCVGFPLRCTLCYVMWAMWVIRC